MKARISIFISGILFGLGLSISQMIYRERVLGFLDIFGAWDPTLLYVLCGAVLTTLISFRFVLKRPAPLLDDEFHLPRSTIIDTKLVFGAAIFGVGWGVGGYCPGPGFVATTLLLTNPFIFIAAFFVGSKISALAFER